MPLYVICLGLSLGAAFLYLRFKNPTYIISANLVTKGHKNSYNTQLRTNQKAYPIKSSGLRIDELEMIKYRSAILAVVKNLNLSVRYQKKSKFVDQDLHKDSPVKFQLVRIGAPGSEQFDVLIKDKKTYLLKKGGTNAGEFAFDQIYTSEIGSWVISRMPSSDKFIGQTVTIQVQDPEEATESLLSNILISPVGNAQNAIQFSLKDTALDRGKAILSQVIGQLNLTLAKEKAIESEIDIQFIDRSLLALGGKVDSLQMELNALSSAERDKELSSTSINYLNIAKNNGIAFNEINFELAALGSLEAYIRNPDLNIVPTISTSGLRDTALNNLVGQLIMIHSQSQRLLETHLINEPIFDTLNQKAARIRKSIGQSVLSLKSVLFKKRADLNAIDNRSQIFLNSLPAWERKLVNIKRKQIVYENQYALLIERKEEASLKRASNIYTNEIPDPTYKVDVIKESVYTWAIICGLLVPSIIVAGRTMHSSKNHHKTP